VNGQLLSEWSFTLSHIFSQLFHFFFFGFVVVFSYVVTFVSLYFPCVCSLLVFSMYYLRGETSFLALFWFFLLVLLLSVAMVVLSGLSFADVVLVSLTVKLSKVSMLPSRASRILLPPVKVVLLF
jgi:hypothetical protein